MKCEECNNKQSDHYSFCHECMRHLMIDDPCQNGPINDYNTPEWLSF